MKKSGIVSASPGVVVVEGCRVEGGVVGERHAARERELEEPLVLGGSQQLLLVQLRARAIRIQLEA